MSAEEVAEAAIRGIEEERFLILPHPEVAEYFRRKADDYDRWLRGMRRLQRQVRGGRSGSGEGTPGAKPKNRLLLYRPSTARPNFSRLMSGWRLKSISASCWRMS